MTNCDNNNNNNIINNKIIDIYLINNSDALVWNTEDIYIIRKQLRLVGSLLGSVENFKNLSTINSIPLLLSSCEVRLGLENGWFRLLDESCEYPIVSDQDLVLFNKEREDIYKLQIDGFLDNKIQKEKEFRSKYSNINLNKKSKKNKNNTGNSDEQQQQQQQLADPQQQQQQQQPANQQQQSIDQQQQSIDQQQQLIDQQQQQQSVDQQQSINNQSVESQNLLNEEDIKRKLIEKEKILNNFKAFNNDIFIYTSTKEAIEKEPTSKLWRDKRKFNQVLLQDFQFPNDQDENLKYIVFKDLWSRGYYISGGSKFGGTFLVYKGDPFLYHATFIVVLKHYTQEFQALDLLTSSRLAVHVNKTTLFASINNKTNKPDYLSITWRGVT